MTNRREFFRWLMAASFLGLALGLCGCRPERAAGPHAPVRHPDGAAAGVAAVVAGERHSLAVLADGTVAAWGWNDGGQICGRPPGRHPRLETIRAADGRALGGGRAVALGGSHAVVLGRDGTAWCWGGNAYGQLGKGDRENAPSPVAVRGPDGVGVLSNLVAVAAGGLHTVALQGDGSVWAWGRGNSGQLGGTNRTAVQTTPARVRGPEGRGWLDGIRAIAAGRACTVALASDGTVWSWGANGNGQLGDGTKNDRHAPVQVVGPDGSGALTGIVAVAASPLSGDLTAALGADGTVWTWGANDAGQLGDGTRPDGRDKPGRVVGPGGDGILTGIVAVAVSGTHALALGADGALWAWGDNRFGQLGDGTTVNRSFPVRVQLAAGRFGGLAAGARHSIAIRADGTPAAWGNDWFGQLGGQAVVIPERKQPPGRCADGYVLWTTARRLMPQWGFYPNGQAYGGVKPLDGSAAWTLGENMIVWIPDIPAAGRYHLWTRHVYGTVAATINEQPLAGARGGPGGGAFAWRHLGSRELAAGSPHVDIRVRGQCMFDAVLLTTSDRLNPNTDPLPDPVEQPVTRAPRRYRDDTPLRAVAAGRPFVTGRMPLFDTQHLNDWLPATNDLLRAPLQLWGAAGQYVGGSFGIRALESLDDLEVVLPALTGPGGQRIERAAIDVRVVHLRERTPSLFSWSSSSRRLMPELLLRDGRVASLPPAGAQGGFGGGVCRLAVPRGESRQIWLTIQVASNLPPGLYAGDIALKTGRTAHRRQVALEVLPLDLRPVDGYYSIYHPARPATGTSKHGIPESRYRAELDDMVRHGLNTVSLYGGFETLHYARDAGMTQAPCIMSWPGGRDYLKQVEAAKAMGFADLLYYGIDEAGTPEQIEKCRKEAERRRRIGLKTLTAISVPRAAWEGLRDVIEYPVLINHVYGGKDTAYARERGHCPVSYWMTSCTFPMWFRAYAGLYNTARGFRGTMPWSYTDHTDPMLKYDPDAGSHQVTYPDGEGLPIPTLQWEAYREGINDVRYLQALDRAIAAGAVRLAEPAPPEGLEAAVARARGVRRRHFEASDETWFRYLIRAQQSDLDTARRAFAEAAIGIGDCLKR